MQKKTQSKLRSLIERIIKEERLNEGRYPEISDVIAYIVKRKPTNKESIFFFLSRYLKQNGFQYLSASFDDYNSDVSDIVRNVSRKLKIDTSDKMSIEQFTSERGSEPKVGFKWQVDVGAPGKGSVKFTVKKVDNEYVYYSTDTSGVRELDINDVI